MRAIIIDDKDARALLDMLKLDSVLREVDTPSEREIIQRVHSRFHYIVTRWLLDQGARVTR